MNRHAYMIIVHDEFELLYILCSLLDDERNDIYIHVDKKVPVSDYESIKNSLSRSIIKSNIIFVEDRINVSWGGYSLIQAELALYKRVLDSGKKYLFCHLISGHDLPIKDINEINEFFEKHKDYEFVSFNNETDWLNKEFGRLMHFRFFQEKRGRKRLGLWTIPEMCVLSIQKILKIDRTRNSGFDYSYGPNWMSASMDLLRYLLEQENVVERNFKHTKCGDEFWKQTLLVHTKFYERRYIADTGKHFSLGENNCMRLVDWDKGGPYTWTIDDIDDIEASNMLFARKFSLKEKPQRDVVEYLNNSLRK